MKMTQKKQRCDASDNRSAILRAAADVFALQGFDVTLADIAARAGVSRTTLYRHFPDRASLGLAIFEHHLQDLEQLAGKLATQDDALLTVLDALMENFASSAGLADVINRQTSALPRLSEIHERAVRALTPLLRTAQQAALVRPDLEPSDLAQLLDVFSAALGNGDLAQRRQRAHRILDLLWTGIGMQGSRPGAPEPATF
jgi:AcrR family transcriptional regulator